MSKEKFVLDNAVAEKVSGDLKAWPRSAALLYADWPTGEDLPYRLERKEANPDAGCSDGRLVGKELNNRKNRMCEYLDEYARSCSSEEIESYLLTRGEREFKCSCCRSTGFHLCILGDHHGVLRSLDREEVNGKNAFGKSALHLACESGKWETFEYLLACGADPNAVDHRGVSALLISLRKGDLAKVQLLLEKGARLERGESTASDSYRRSLLHFAVLQGSRRMLKLLLKYSAEMDAQDVYGMTPLHLAVAYGRVSLLRELLAAGASTDLRCRNGWTLVHLATWFEQQSSLEILLKAGVEIDHVDEKESSALHEAARLGNAKIIKILTSHGCWLDRQDKYLRTALHVAVVNGYTKVAKLLLSCGASTIGLLAPLQRLVNLGQRDMLLLLAKHVDINARDRYGNTLLKTAVLRNNSDLVKILLDEGADAISIRGILNCPIITEAIRRNNPRIVRLLLEKGADVLSCDDLGRSPLYFAYHSNSQEILQLFQHRAFF